MIQVAILNQSTVLSDANVQAALPAMQTQVSRDFAPLWGIDATLAFVPAGSAPPLGSWQLVVLDDSDQAGALGYHLLNDGAPRGFVFAKTDLKAGLNWCVTFSHELLEMLLDPFVFSTVLVEGAHRFMGTSGSLLAQEVADACEADQFGYSITVAPPAGAPSGAKPYQVLVSDFVTPAWFGAPAPASGKYPTGKGLYDFGGHCSAPFQLLPGGYIGVYDFRGGMGWTQKTAQGGQLSAREIPRLSRRDRRMCGPAPAAINPGAAAA